MKYSNDRVKIIPCNDLEKILKKDKIDYYVVNNTINIILNNCFEGLDLVKKHKNHIKEFEILRGDMDDVFLNITGRKLVND